MGFTSQYHMVICWKFIRQYNIRWIHFNHDAYANFKVRIFLLGNSIIIENFGPTGVDIRVGAKSTLLFMRIDKTFQLKLQPD